MQSGPSQSGHVRLFVLAGQRNMEGEDSFVSEIAGQPNYEALAVEQPDVSFRYSLGGGVKASPDWQPLGPVDFLGNFGPELSFGARLRKSVDRKDGLAIIKFTHSGAQGPDWFPKGSAESHRDLYPKLIRFVRDAQADLKRQGYSTSLDGVFWHTGENDTYFGPYAQNNATWLKQLIDQTRADLNQPDLAWFIFQQHQKSPWRNIDKVNEALNEMARTDPHVIIIPTSDLPHGRLHFETEGTLMLGDAMADAYLQKQSSIQRKGK